MFHAATDSNADFASGDSVSLARSISKDRLASNVTSIRPKHQTSVLPPPRAAQRRVNNHGLLGNVHMEDEEETLVARTNGTVIPKRVNGTQAATAAPPKPSAESKPAPNSFYLKPLMPAVIKPAKDKSVCLNKVESGDAPHFPVHRKAPCSLNQTCPPPGEDADLSDEPPQGPAGFRPVVTSSVDPSAREPAEGFYLHSDSEEPKSGQQGLDTELEDLDEEREDLDKAITIKDPNRPRKYFHEEDEEEEEESAKLQKDMDVKEHKDKDLNGGSGRSSPCLSVHSQASGSVRMTSFAERKAQQQRFRRNHDQGGFMRTGGGGSGGSNVLPSEIFLLHMQLKEKRRATEHQRKNMEVLSARQWQKLGKAAFLNIVKKGGGKSDTLPNQLKADISKNELGGEKAPSSKDNMCVDALRGNTVVEGIASPDTLVHFVEHVSSTGTTPTAKPPKLSSGRSRSKPSELKISKEQGQHAARIPTQSGLETVSHMRQISGGRSPRTDSPDSPRNPTAAETIDRPGSGHARSAVFRLHDEANMRLTTRVGLKAVVPPEVSFDLCLSSTPKESELNSSDSSGKNVLSDEMQPNKFHFADIDLSEQKPVMGFFFKDQQKGEEVAKKRAMFLLKQQKNAEEARLRKQHLKAESEQKRDEARRKAEEDWQHKQEEKTRRELIRQEHLRRKQQELFEEQGLVKPKTLKPKQKHRPKSDLREESSSDNFSSCSSTPHNLSNAQSSSRLSLALEINSINSGRAGSRRCDSVESFPGSRNNSRAAGPKLFKQLSAKSNKLIIHNAISHCCLVGKVNEPQRNQILDELEKCESNHLMILFRDSGCQFRALYSYFPDTEEIQKLTGTGPKSIGKKMIDKLYKYSSDRKQFTVIPAKTVSVSVDALTILNHLWQAKRGAGPKKSGK